MDSEIRPSATIDDALNEVRGYVAKTIDNIECMEEDGPSGIVWQQDEVLRLLTDIMTMSEVVAEADPEVIVMQVELDDDEEELIVVTHGVHTSWPHMAGGHQMDYYDDGEIVVACPHGCGSTDFNEIDRSERWNRLRMEVQPDTSPYSGEPNELAGLPFLVVNQGDGNYETVGWRCEGCGGSVSFPEWVEVEWF